MRLLIDLQGAQTESRYRGIGRYAMALAQAMIENPRTHRIEVLLNGAFEDTIEPIRARFDRLIPQDRIHLWFPCPRSGAGFGAPRWRYQASSLIRSAAIRRLQPDVVHVSSVFEGFIDDAVTDVRSIGDSFRVAVTCYDLIPLLNAEDYLPPAQPITEHYQDRLNEVRAADRILAISAAGRDEVIRHLPADPDRVHDIGAACDETFVPMPLAQANAEADLAALGIDRPFLMYTGGSDSRKNLKRLIQAFAGLPTAVRERHQLVLVGRIPPAHQTELRERARQAGLASTGLILTDWVSDQSLRALYALCTGFVFPSLHEGFGLPALEAMACGAPTIASRASSLIEVMRRDEAMFDPLDVTAIGAAMTRLLTSSEWRQQLRDEGIAEASRYSWQRSAERALDAIESIPAESNHAESNHAEAIAVESRAALAWSSETGQEAKAVARKIAACDAISRDRVELAPIADRIVASLPQGGARLLVDVSTIAQLDIVTGIQRVVRAIATDWIATPPEDCEVVLVRGFSDRPGYRRASRYRAEIAERGETGSASEPPIAIRPTDVFLGLDLAHAVVSRNRETYAHWRRLGVRVNFIVYDLLPILMREHFSRIPDGLHAEWLGAIAHGDGLICISRAVADELLDWLDRNGPARQRSLAIGWFHLGADLSATRPSRGLPPDWRQTLERIRARPAFLIVGTIEPRKGHGQSLAAFEQLWADGHDFNLVVVGREGWGTDQLCERMRRHPKYDRRLFWLKDISDEFLEQLYDASDALIAPSLGEGFGLPIVEARLHGKPVIARDIPVFREVAGADTTYFSGTDAASLAQAIAGWLTSSAAAAGEPAPAGTWLTWHQSRMQLERVVLGGDWYRQWSGRSSGSDHNPA